MTSSPQTSPQSEDLTAKEYVQLAYMCLDRGHVEQAYDACQKANALLGPQDPTALVLHCGMQIGQGDFTQAMLKLKTLSKKFPTHPELHIYLAEALFFMKRGRQAKRALDKAMALDLNTEQRALVNAMADFWMQQT